jgi:ABC-2 type transport system permease protein
VWNRIYALTIKEFLALLKDRKSRIVVIVPPIVQLIVFGYAATFDLTNIPYAVYNEDEGLASTELISAFRGSPNFEEIAYITREEEIAPLINSKKALMVLHIDTRFSRDLSAGTPGFVQIIIDGRDSNTAAILLTYVNSILAQFNQKWQRQLDHGLPPGTLDIRAWYNPNLVSRWFIVPGIVALLMLVVTTLVTALSVAREREQGTFDQLLVTPFRPVEILIGKALPGFIIGLAEATVIIFIIVLWFQIPLRGNPLTLYFGLLMFLLSTVGFGLMISSLAVTQQQGLLGAFLFLLPAVILSGFATPIANMPRWVQDITLLNPMRYFIVIVRGIFLEGTPFLLLINQFWPLAVTGVASLVLAGWLFRRRMY